MGGSRLRVGTGFIAPNAETTREGMSASAFNKCMDALRAVLEIAREQGVIYKNHAEEIVKAPVKKKRLELRSPAQFLELAKTHCDVRLEVVGRLRGRGSPLCLFAFSGLRRREGTAVRWRYVDFEKKLLRVPGTKTDELAHHSVVSRTGRTAGGNSNAPWRRATRRPNYSCRFRVGGVAIGMPEYAANGSHAP